MGPPTPPKRYVKILPTLSGLLKVANHQTVGLYSWTRWFRRVSSCVKCRRRMYPALYRIPPISIDDLDQQEQIRHQRVFCFRESTLRNWHWQEILRVATSNGVRRCYSNAEFPDDVDTLPYPLCIAIC